MSIKRKLTLTIMGISMAAVLLTAFAITAYLIYDLRSGKAQELGVTAGLTADRNRAALLFLDDERARKNLEVFTQNPSIRAACIYTAKGVLFAAYSASGGSCPLGTQINVHSQEGMLTASRVIFDNGMPAGSVYIASDTSEIDAYVQKIIGISLTAALLVLLVTGVLAAYFQRTISAPILELAATAEAITARGDYSISAREGDNEETGTLARAFNAMLSEVRERDRKLVQANETLEQKVVERTFELEEAMHRARQASAAKSEFLRNMSHEFRTPLHALISFSSYGMHEHETAQRTQLKHYFELIQTGAKRLSTLVDEILDLARMEHGEHVFALKRVDLREPLRGAIALVQPLLRDKELRLSLECEDNAGDTVCDQDKIIQVVTNLLGNAIKFTPAGRGITLSLRRAELDGQRAVAVTVTDQGVGIPEGEEETIFESFKQSSRTNSGAGGTGLGLAICRRLIEAHNGYITAKNNPDGIGASVTFVIPAVLPEGRKVIRINEMES